MTVVPDHLQHVRTVATRLTHSFDKPPTEAAARKALDEALEAEREEALAASARFIVGRVRAEAENRELKARREREKIEDGKRRRKDALKAHRILYGRKLAAALAEAAAPWDRVYVANIGQQRCAFTGLAKLEAAEQVAIENGLKRNRFGPPVAAESIGTVTGSLDLVDPEPADLYALLNAEIDAVREAEAKKAAATAERVEREREQRRYGVSLAGATED